MPQPVQVFGGPSTTNDAEILRRKLAAARAGVLRQFAVPSDAILSDAEKEKRLEKDAEHAAELTAKLAVIARVVPSLPGKIFATAVAGVEKTKDGGVHPGVGTAGNFLPQPFGFVDPTVVGLKRNFYLPPGSTGIIPHSVDQFGFGVPEQRAEDERRALERDLRLTLSRNKSATKAVANESDETLQALIAGQGGLSRAGVVRASSGVGTVDLENAASAELALRNLARSASAPIGPDINPPTGGPVRFVPGDQAGADVNQEVAHATEVDRLFAANPPDP